MTNQHYFRALYLFLLMAATSLTFTSCGDEDDDPKPPTKTEILSSHQWSTSRILIDGVDVTNHPSMAPLATAKTKHETNGTYSQTSSGGNTTGRWEFYGNETILVFDPRTADEEQWNITELTATSLKLRNTVIEDGQTYLVELEMR